MRRLFCAMSGALLGASLATPALALDAAKPVTLMVPYPAGGVSDAIARIFSGPLGKELGSTVIVDNLGGVSGSLAAQKVLAAPADGQMLFQASPNEVILAPLASKAVKLKSEDFRMVLPISNAIMVVYARKDLPANTMDELIELARKNGAASPLSYGSVGIGSLYHILVERMQQLTKTTMNHIPYKGAAPVMQDLLGSRVDFAILPHGAAGHALAKEGKLKLLASLEAKPLAFIDLPLVADSKALKGFAYTIWTGYMVPRATPDSEVAKLHKALDAVIRVPRVRGELQGQFQVVAPSTTPAEADRAYLAEIKRYQELARQVNLQAQ